MRFEGRRSQVGNIVTYGEENKILPLFTDLVNHSPDGFEWGYGGSGPSQLAFAIIYQETGNLKTARNCYQQFKREIIQNFKHDSWVLREGVVDEWLSELR